MIYLKRILTVVFCIPRVLLALCSVFVLWLFDFLAIPVYYIITGRYYISDYYPISIAIALWLCGFGFDWKEEKNEYNRPNDAP